MKTLTFLAIGLSGLLILNPAQAGMHHENNRQYQRHDDSASPYKPQKRHKQQKAYRKGYRHGMRDQRHEDKRAWKKYRKHQRYERRPRHAYERRYYRPAPHYPRVVPHVRYPAPLHPYRIHRPHHSPLPLFAGGLLGGVIANDISHGDPVATGAGVLAGTILGHELEH